MGLATLKTESLFVSLWFCLFFTVFFPHLVPCLAVISVQWTLVLIFLSFPRLTFFQGLWLLACMVLRQLPVGLLMFLCILRKLYSVCVTLTGACVGFVSMPLFMLICHLLFSLFLLWGLEGVFFIVIMKLDGGVVLRSCLFSDGRSLSC
jgi:hypothetical protein